MQQRPTGPTETNTGSGVGRPLTCPGCRQEGIRVYVGDASISGCIVAIALYCERGCVTTLLIGSEKGPGEVSWHDGAGWATLREGSDAEAMLELAKLAQRAGQRRENEAPHTPAVREDPQPDGDGDQRDDIVRRIAERIRLRPGWSELQAVNLARQMTERSWSELNQVGNSGAPTTPGVNIRLAEQAVRQVMEPGDKRWEAVVESLAEVLYDLRSDSLQQPSITPGHDIPAPARAAASTGRSRLACKCGKEKLARYPECPDCMDMVLCENCGERYHRPEYGQCYTCHEGL